MYLQPHVAALLAQDRLREERRRSRRRHSRD